MNLVLPTPEQIDFVHKSSNDAIRNGAAARHTYSIINRAEHLEALAEAGKDTDAPDFLANGLLAASRHLRSLAIDETPVYGFRAVTTEVAGSGRKETEVSMAKLDPITISVVPHTEITVGTVIRDTLGRMMNFTPKQDGIMTIHDVRFSAIRFLGQQMVGVRL